MDPQELLQQIIARKWVAVAAIVIGIIVRLLKSDTKIPIDIPPRLRPWLAIGLGAAAGALDKLTNVDKVTWTTALLEGVTAAVVAIVSHTLVIQSARDGKELNVPGLIKENTPPGPGAPPTLPPKGSDLTPPADPPAGNSRTRLRSLVLLVCAVFLAIWTTACSWFTPANVAKVELAGEDIACILEHSFVNDGVLNELCDKRHVWTAEQKQTASRTALAHRTQLAKELKAARAESCVDGGAPDAGRPTSSREDVGDGGAK